MEARIVRDHIPVRTDYHLSDCRCLEVDCADHDTYMSLPRVVEKDGDLFGLTGWNSDRGMAYYKTGVPFARTVL